MNFTWDFKILHFPYINECHKPLWYWFIKLIKYMSLRQGHYQNENLRHLTPSDFSSNCFQLIKIVESTFNCCNNQLIKKKSISLRLPFLIGYYKHETVPLNNVMNIKIKRAVALAGRMHENVLLHTIVKLTLTVYVMHTRVLCQPALHVKHSRWFTYCVT